MFLGRGFSIISIILNLKSNDRLELYCEKKCLLILWALWI